MMMPHCCCCNWQDVYIEESIRPPARFPACDCSRSKIEVKRKISIPRFRYDARCRTSCCNHPEIVRCSCDHVMPSERCLCYECRKFRGRSEAIIHQREEIARHKYSLLETWFTRFDANGDGYLDLVELESLLNHLDASIRHPHSKRILKTCDIDSDGRLSFVEFVRLWERVTHHDGFTRKIGCPELSGIAKKYNLFSDARPCECQEYRCRHTTVAAKPPLHPVKCGCGEEENVTLFVKHDHDRRAHSRPRKKSANKSPKGVPEEMEDEGDLPTMSMNRNDIV